MGTSLRAERRLALLVMAAMAGCSGGMDDDAGATLDAGRGADGGDMDAGVIDDDGGPGEDGGSTDGGPGFDGSIGRPDGSFGFDGSIGRPDGSFGFDGSIGFDASFSCSSNADCWILSFYCLKAARDCRGSGMCVSRPGFCADVIAPVCGCNGRTYRNECLAHRAGVNVASTGRCP